jgi:hypothetical protein
MDLRKLRKNLKKSEAAVMKAQVDTSLTGATREILLWTSLNGY